MRAVIVAHCRPFVGPFAAALGAFVEIPKPSLGVLLVYRCGCRHRPGVCGCGHALGHGNNTAVRYRDDGDLSTRWRRALLFSAHSVIALVRRHVPCPAIRTVVVAHRRPLVGPFPAALGTFIEISKPCHCILHALGDRLTNNMKMTNLEIANDSTRGKRNPDIPGHAELATAAVSFA